MQLLLLFVGLFAVTHGEDYLGEYVGDFSNTDHDVMGKIYVVDDTHLRIRHFTYDGKAPDAFFYFGDKDGGPDAPSGDGTILMDQYGRELQLDAYINADIILELEGESTVHSIKWLSVWCRQVGALFGEFYFPNSLTVPAPADIGVIPEGAHAVQSGTVTLLDKRRIMIEDFYYDGAAPDTFFWIGTGTPDANGMQIPDEDGSMEILGDYNGETLVLTLPRDMTVDDIDYLSVWCKQVSENFGHLEIPDNLMVPPYTMHIEGYYGKQVGDFANTFHGVEGTLYVVNQKTLRVRNFYYDGKGPDAHFWIGSSDQPDDSGIALPVLGSTSAILGEYEDGNVLLTLPEGTEFTDYTWFSVWCKNVSANFGDILLPEVYVYNLPEPLGLGTFSEKAHQVSSGTVTILDVKTIHIQDFTYDGRGPDAFFYVGTGDAPNTGSGMKIPDEEGSLAKAKKYDGKTIKLTLPDDMTFMDISWLSMYCISFKENFGHVMIPHTMLNVPGEVEEPDMNEMENCEQLHDFFNVAWQIDGEYIELEFTGALETEYGYMAFGLSGSDSSSAMGAADVTVASYMEGEPMAKDFFLNAYSQCSGATGVCEDKDQGGVNDIEDVEGYQMDGITTVRFRRKMNTGDSKDREYPASGAMHIVWAMGLINMNSGLVTKHNIRLTQSTTIDFGRTPSRNCPPVVSRNPPVAAEPWKIPTYYASPDEDIEVCIGSAGPSERGYSAITGSNSWGIAWYVNDWLIPEIVVERGRTYTFKVSGGDNPDMAAKYHPFYITDDPIGGYVSKSDQQKSEVKIYAGETVGQYCEFEETSLSDDSTESFKEFSATLVKECDPGSSAGTLTWTPDDDTPDMVYYQCYTHRYLGYKITVVDKMVSGSNRVCSYVHIVNAALLVIGALLAARQY